ncbi:MAG: hypothetical protein P9L94_09405 [Candidatus Hinthialibacter antarcticus]|nr:hypothetical protein [Candidatus Hinthialibacter antarcticus]
MNQNLEVIESAAHSYEENGFAIFCAFSSSDICKLTEFAHQWLYRLLDKWVNGKQDTHPLGEYHLWFRELGVEHNSLFKANNRHTTPPEEIANILMNPSMIELLNQLGCSNYERWDEGLGWLAFRFIRPGFGDGYPFSRKEWGAAKDVFSFWIPIIGFTPQETIALVPGSHKREYESYLPENGKFRKDELYFAGDVTQLDPMRPSLSSGDAIMFHPRLLHSENIEVGETTRLSLEFRIKPI